METMTNMTSINTNVSAYITAAVNKATSIAPERGCKLIQMGDLARLAGANKKAMTEALSASVRSEAKRFALRHYSGVVEADGGKHFVWLLDAETVTLMVPRIETPETREKLVALLETMNEVNATV